MEWTRSETLALAGPDCACCKGRGLRKNLRKEATPCSCVLRAIFRTCYARFRQCVTKEKHLSRPELEFSARGGGRTRWARKDEEYIADFLLVARRHLPEDLYQVFNYYFLLRAGSELCCKRLNMDRGIFYSYVYRVQETLGRVYRELEPYSLYPLDEYFRGRTENTFSFMPRVHRLAPGADSGRMLMEKIGISARQAA